MSKLVRVGTYVFAKPFEAHYISYSCLEESLQWNEIIFVMVLPDPFEEWGAEEFRGDTEVVPSQLPMVGTRD